MKSWILKLAIKYIAWYVSKMPEGNELIDFVCFRIKEVFEGKAHHKSGYVHHSCKSLKVYWLVDKLLDACEVKRDIEITKEWVEYEKK